LQNNISLLKFGHTISSIIRQDWREGIKLTAHSFLVPLIAVFKFSKVSWWYSGSHHEKSKRATAYNNNNKNKNIRSHKIYNHPSSINSSVKLHKHNLRHTRHASFKTARNSFNRSRFRTQCSNNLCHCRKKALHKHKYTQSIIILIKSIIKK
jgi:hypothetical protein